MQFMNYRIVFIYGKQPFAAHFFRSLDGLGLAVVGGVVVAVAAARGQRIKGAQAGGSRWFVREISDVGIGPKASGSLLRVLE